MNEPTITCPHCKAEVRLTEALAAPLIRTNKKIADKEAEIARRESAIREQRAELARAVELYRTAVHYQTQDRAKEDCGRGGHEGTTSVGDRS